MKKTRTDKPTEKKEQATLGGGCFWCTEAVFSQIKGVIKIEPGYAGGQEVNPTYKQVCTGRTGHAEVIQITFDSEIITYRELLEIFFLTHNPTTLNRQGNDVGTQYRSVIFYHNQNQKRIAETLIEELNAAHQYNAPIVTQLEPYTTFYSAEEYHREYYKRNPEQPYCRVIIAPKIKKLRNSKVNKLKLDGGE